MDSALEERPSKEQARLAHLASQFLDEIKDFTPGKSLEATLNSDYGPGNALFDEMEQLALLGLKEGWLAHVEIRGPRYRRARFREPSEELRGFNITAVFMEVEPGADKVEGPYHTHPHGEINMVIPVTGEKPELEGLDNFWVNRGWTSPGPGSHHYPRARGGGILALFFLPGGQISFEAQPNDPQPDVNES